MTLHPSQSAERLAVLIARYVRACRRLRLADGDGETRRARLDKADCRKVLGTAERTFDSIGGDVEELARRLHEHTLRMSPAGAGCDTIRLETEVTP